MHMGDIKCTKYEVEKLEAGCIKYAQKIGFGAINMLLAGTSDPKDWDVKEDRKLKPLEMYLEAL